MLKFKGVKEGETIVVHGSKSGQYMLFTPRKYDADISTVPYYCCENEDLAIKYASAMRFPENYEIVELKEDDSILLFSEQSDLCYGIQISEEREDGIYVMSAKKVVVKYDFKDYYNYHKKMMEDLERRTLKDDDEKDSSLPYMVERSNCTPFLGDDNKNVSLPHLGKVPGDAERDLKDFSKNLPFEIYVVGKLRLKEGVNILSEERTIEPDRDASKAKTSSREVEDEPENY